MGKSRSDKYICFLEYSVTFLVYSAFSRHVPTIMATPQELSIFMRNCNNMDIIIEYFLSKHPPYGSFTRTAQYFPKTTCNYSKINIFPNFQSKREKTTKV